MALPRFKGGVRAGVIRQIIPEYVIGVGMCSRLVFDNNTISILIPQWVEEHNPQVGKWFVTNSRQAYVTDEFVGEHED